MDNKKAVDLIDRIARDRDEKRFLKYSITLLQKLFLLYKT